MTPNPTVRPFVAGALLFLTLIGLWPGRASAARAETASSTAAISAAAVSASATRP
jgi:hypothetical protein